MKIIVLTEINEIMCFKLKTFFFFLLNEFIICYTVGRNNVHNQVESHFII